VLCFPAFRLRQRVSATCCIRERVRTLMYIPHARSKGGVGHATNAFLNAAASRLVTVGYGWYGPPWAATCVLRERACTIPVTRCTLEAKADCLPLWSLGLALLITDAAALRASASVLCRTSIGVPCHTRCSYRAFMFSSSSLLFLVVLLLSLSRFVKCHFLGGVVCSVFFFSSTSIYFFSPFLFPSFSYTYAHIWAQLRATAFGCVDTGACTGQTGENGIGVVLAVLAFLAALGAFNVGLISFLPPSSCLLSTLVLFTTSSTGSA